MEILFMGVAGELVMGDIDHVTQAEEDRYLALCAPAVRPHLGRQMIRLRMAERLMCAAATDEQWAIGWSGHVTVDMDRVWGFAARRFPRAADAARRSPGIYGELIGYEAVAEREEAVAAMGLTNRPLDHLGLDGITFSAPDPAQSLPLLESAHAAGWRYGRWYSQVDPDGDLGQHHVAHLIPISRRQFLAARRDGWPAWTEGA